MLALRKLKAKVRKISVDERKQNKMVKKYVKKPIPVEAIQWTGDNFDELEDFAGNNIWVDEGHLFVMTLEGAFKSKNKTGDYLIKGIRGEFYICEKDIFEETYEEVKEEEK